MKKSILAAIFGIIVGAIHAQETISPWQIGITASPEYAYRITTAGSDGLSQAQKDLYDQLESHIFGTTSGLSARYALTPKFYIQAGAQYSLRGFKMDSLQVIRDLDNPDKIDLAKLIHHFHYLDIPVGLYGEIGSGKFRFAINGGLSVSFVMAQKYRLDFYSDGVTERGDITGDQKNVGLTTWFGTGFSWYMHEHFHLQIMPIFRYMLTPINGGSFKTYFWNAGVEAGIFYQF